MLFSLARVPGPTGTPRFQATGPRPEQQVTTRTLVIAIVIDQHQRHMRKSDASSDLKQITSVARHPSAPEGNFAALVCFLAVRTHSVYQPL